MPKQKGNEKKAEPPDPVALEEVRNALAHEDYRVRVRAVEGLRRHGDEESIALLRQALSDGRKQVRATAAHVLGQLRAREAVEPLREALSDRTASVRKKAVEALARIGGVEVLDIVLPMLGDKDRGIRRKAIVVLASYRDPRIVEPLLEAADKFALQDLGLLQEILAALAPLNDIRTAPLLCSVLEIGLFRISYRAAGMLRSLGDSKTLPRLVLAANHLSPAWRVNTLSLLRNVRYGLWFSPFALRYPIPAIALFCAQALEEGGDAELRRGARMVLSYLELVRGSARDTSGDGAELLRASHASRPGGGGDTLLRASEQDDESEPAPARFAFWQWLRLRWMALWRI